MASPRDRGAARRDEGTTRALREDVAQFGVLPPPVRNSSHRHVVCRANEDDPACDPAVDGYDCVQQQYAWWRVTDVCWVYMPARWGDGHVYSG